MAKPAIISRSSVSPGYVNGSAANSQYYYPRAAVLGNDGYIYVTDNGNGAVRKLDSGGASTTLVTGFTSVAGITVSRTSGTLYCTLLDVNPSLVSKQAFGYDQYNNQTDAWEYDFGAGSPGPFLRHIHTDFLRKKPDPDGPQMPPNYQESLDIHIRSFPSVVTVFDASEVARSVTKYVYDQYPMPGLTARPNITGHDTTATNPPSPIHDQKD